MDPLLKNTHIKEEEIKLMAKLAVYDKTHGETDRAANGLYYRDYVYKKNFFIRFCALMGCLLPIILYVVTLFMDDGVDFLGFDYTGLLINMGTIIAVVLVAYTFVGTKIATAEYKAIKLRLKEYFTLMRELETLRGDHQEEAEVQVQAQDQTEASKEEAEDPLEAAKCYQEQRYEARRKERDQIRSANGNNDRNTGKYH